jgi:hypothetical protein
MRTVSVMMRRSKGLVAQAEPTDRAILPVTACLEAAIKVTAWDAGAGLAIVHHRRMMNVITMESLVIGPENASQIPRRSRPM